MNRHLHVKYMRTGATKGKLQIVSQSHLNSTFTDKGPEFIYTCATGDKISLYSDGGPDYAHNSARTKLYVRGTRYDIDFCIVNIKNKFDHILNAILQYNQTYSRNRLEMDDVTEEVKSDGFLDDEDEDDDVDDEYEEGEEDYDVPDG